MQEQKINKQIGYQCKLFVHQKKSSSTFTVEREELGMREITQGQRNTLVGNSPTTFTLHTIATELTYKARREHAVDIMDVTPQQMKMNKNFKQEPMTRSMQLHYIPVTAFSDRSIFRSNFLGMRLP